MSKTIVGIFDNYSSAEKTATQINENGLKTSDISILTKHPDNNLQTQTTLTNPNPPNTNVNQIHDNVSDGVATGTVLGGLAGLLMGIGTVVIPGLGIIAAAGPIVGLLSGAVTGGVVGGMIDLGIPEDDSIYYESEIKSGKVFLSMNCSDENIEKVSSILKNCGAVEIKTY